MVSSQHNVTPPDLACRYILIGSIDVRTAIIKDWLSQMAS